MRVTTVKDTGLTQPLTKAQQGAADAAILMAVVREDAEKAVKITVETNTYVEDEQFDITFNTALYKMLNW